MDADEPVDIEQVELAIHEAREARDHLLDVDADAILHDEGEREGEPPAGGEGGEGEAAGNQAAEDPAEQAPDEDRPRHAGGLGRSRPSDDPGEHAPDEDPAAQPEETGDSVQAGRDRAAQPEETGDSVQAGGDRAAQAPDRDPGRG